MTSYELRITNDELRDSPRPPEGGQAAKAIVICPNGNKLQITNDELRITNDEAKVVIIC